MRTAATGTAAAAKIFVTTAAESHPAPQSVRPRTRARSAAAVSSIGHGSKRLRKTEPSSTGASASGASATPRRSGEGSSVRTAAAIRTSVAAPQSAIRILNSSTKCGSLTAGAANTGRAPGGYST